jgi:pyrroloquinoline-quinone synthase
VTAFSPEAFADRLRNSGRHRYHDKHPFHVRMHEGTLSREQIRAWVLNRYYYQTRIPIKDALVISKSEDPAFRRMWIRRIHDHDDPNGGIAQWEKLATGVGLDAEEVKSLRSVLPAARFACDAYVSLVRNASLVEAVASSLTEFFAPDIMRTRIAAWEKHYPWIDSGVLDYFRSRPAKATRDSGEALEFVTTHATTQALQDACTAALLTKCEILWALLDAVVLAYPT